MVGGIRNICVSFLLAMSVMACVGSGANAEDGAWRVNKSSGDVSITTSGVQQAALTEGAVLKPGDSIRTGQTGRVLLLRGEESILVSPNSFIRIPTGQTDGMSTTIIQQAGSILLDVEKRNVKHFEVVTPYLAAVVKGTRFRVTVNPKDADVDVVRGQVEVTDFKSGQIASVLPGQSASVSAQGKGGLTLSGSGVLSPIQQGVPRQSTVPPLMVVDEHRAAADGSTMGPKVREALAPGESVSVPVMSGTNTTDARNTDQIWSDSVGVQAKSWLNSLINSWWDRSDDRTINFAVPLGVGFIVAVGVAGQRRRKQQKGMQPPAK